MNIPENVYYVCYGSNLHENRFKEYMETQACFNWDSINTMADWEKALEKTDAIDNIESYRVNLNYDVYFAGNSGRWGGGIAYLDVDGYSKTKVYRAYKISREQFESLFSQENGYYSNDLAWNHIVNNRETRTDAYFYSRIINLGTIDGIPALTFTNADSYESIKYANLNGMSYYDKLNAPGQKYVDVIDKGRKETRKLPFKEIKPLEYA